VIITLWLIAQLAALAVVGAGVVRWERADRPRHIERLDPWR
jgi:hypothetical protein